MLSEKAPTQLVYLMHIVKFLRAPILMPTTAYGAIIMSQNGQTHFKNLAANAIFCLTIDLIHMKEGCKN